MEWCDDGNQITTIIQNFRRIYLNYKKRKRNAIPIAIIIFSQHPFAIPLLFLYVQSQNAQPTSKK